MVNKLVGQDMFVNRHYIAEGGLHNTTHNPISFSIKAGMKRIDIHKEYCVGVYLDRRHSKDVGFYIKDGYIEVFEELYGRVLVKPQYVSLGKIMMTPELIQWLDNFNNNILVEPIKLKCFNSDDGNTWIDIDN